MELKVQDIGIGDNRDTSPCLSVGLRAFRIGPESDFTHTMLECLSDKAKNIPSAQSPCASKFVYYGLCHSLALLWLLCSPTPALPEESSGPDGPELMIEAGYGRYAGFLEFTPDGKTLVTDSSGKGKGHAVRAWSLGERGDVRVLASGSKGWGSVRFSPDRKYWAGISAAGLRIFERANGKVTGTLNVAGVGASALTFSPDSRLFAFSTGGSINLWGVHSQGSRVKKPGHYQSVTSIAFSPDGRLVASASKDTKTIIWDVDSASQLRTLEATRPRHPATVAFVGDGRRVITMDAWGMTLWDIKRGTKLRSARVSSASRLHLSHDRRTVWIREGRRSISQRDIDSLEPIRRFSSPRKGKENKLTRYALSADGKLLATGTTWGEVLVWDTRSGEQVSTLREHAHPVITVAFSPDNRLLASSAVDRRILLWSLHTKEVLASLYLLGADGWVVVSPDGSFDGSASGLARMYYLQGLSRIPLEAFFERHYFPRLLPEVTGRGGAPGEGARARRTGDLGLPPLVKITLPAPGQSFTEEEVKVTVRCVDQGSGISEVRLYHNGKLVSGVIRGVRITATEEKSLVREFEVCLLPGTNQLAAVALNDERTESLPHVIHVTREAPAAVADLYVLAIGIDKYLNASYSLNFGKADAGAITQTLCDRGKAIFRRVSKRVILDSGATRERIEGALGELARQARPQDVFVFFFAGHGVMSQGEGGGPADFFLAPFDVTRLHGDHEHVSRKGLSASALRDWCIRIPARKQLVIVDACQAGGAVEMFAMRGAAEEKAIVQLARSTGIVVLASTGQKQFASEFEKLGHGVFTYAMLNGLRGEADGGARPDGKVTVKELEAYLNDRVPELTKQYRGAAQHPNSYSRGQDFPLTVTQ